MEIQCPNCKKAQMTKGRVEFQCRICGTLLRDPRIESVTIAPNHYVSVNDVMSIAKRQGVYNKMKAVLDLPYKEVVE